MVALDETFLLVVRGGANEPDVAAVEIGLEDVGGIEDGVVVAACAHQRVDVVDIDDAAWGLANQVHLGLEGFLHLAAVLRLSHQCAHVEHEHLTVFQAFGYVSVNDLAHQSPHQRRFAHTGLTHVEGVVLVLAAQHLDGAFQLCLTTNQRRTAFQHVVHAHSEAVLRILGLEGYVGGSVIYSECIVEQCNRHFFLEFKQEILHLALSAHFLGQHVGGVGVFQLHQVFQQVGGVGQLARVFLVWHVD